MDVYATELCVVTATTHAPVSVPDDTHNELEIQSEQKTNCPVVLAIKPFNCAIVLCQGAKPPVRVVVDNVVVLVLVSVPVAVLFPVVVTEPDSVTAPSNTAVPVTSTFVNLVAAAITNCVVPKARRKASRLRP